MIEFVDDREVDGLNKGEFAVIVDYYGKESLLRVIKRGANTLSPPDLEIINLIREMEK